MSKRKTTLPSEKLKERLLRTLEEQDSARKEFINTFAGVKQVINSVNEDDLPGSLEAIEHAAALIRQAQSKLVAGEGHITESLDILASDKTGHSMRNIATIIVNEKEFFRGDLDTIAAALDVADLDVLRVVLADNPGLRKKIESAL
jgi:hypothetical protein